ncbi:MAG: dihydroxyacetone kinase subunit DhaL [Rhizobiaceae bacterium]|nr:dihydroxyacetone kinase subunit DhaL [Rhizobiaceae bacterium]
MAETLDAAAVVAMLDAVAQAVVDQADVLTDADLAIGDGDHGTGMKRGFEAARAALKSSPTASIEDAFKAVGMAVLSETGGAAGAIFGTFFRAGGKALSGKELLDGAGFADLLESGLAAVLKRGGVTEGQKTIIDALAPAARAARADGGSLEGASAAAAQGALHGVEATKEMIATTGKARSLGERSLGHPDPGAISVSIILVAMRDFISGN